MKHATLPDIYLLLLICLSATAHISRIAVRLPLKGNRASPGSPWPHPQKWHQTNQVRRIEPSNLKFVTNLKSCDVIEEAFRRYRKIIASPFAVVAGRPTPANDIQRVVVTVGETQCGDDYYPRETSDESYSLEVGHRRDVIVNAKSIWGSLRGLETFSQLLYLSNDKKCVINDTRIEDYPRFRYRGLLIDTARHFIPMPILLTILIFDKTIKNKRLRKLCGNLRLSQSIEDAMSYDKLNVFHWHVVDDQSFPYPSRTFPNLTEYGAYSPSHRYSRNDVTTIIREARLRGIRVIPEFDTPGHTHSWGMALPKLLTPCWGGGMTGGPYVPNYPLHGAAEVINPAQEYTYRVLEALYKEIVHDFPDEFVHLGLDEAYHACWKSNFEVRNWMYHNNISDFSRLEEYYIRRLTDIVTSLGAKYVIWQDPVDHNVSISKDSLVVVWKDSFNGPPGMFEPWQTYMNRVTARGHKVILASPWYLNVISYGQDWRRYYDIEPTNFTDDDHTTRRLVHGGEATVWTEYIDGTNILPLIWPRASAVAERLWSAKNIRDVDSAQFRLDQQRCRMLRRGIPTKPFLPGYCADREWRMQDESKDSNGTSDTSPEELAFLLVLAFVSSVIFC